MKNKENAVPTAIQVERFNRISFAIQKGNYPNCFTLARELDHHRETIRRDIEFMQRLGHPLEFDHSKNGWFYTEPFKPLAQQQVNQNDMLALHLLESACQVLHGTPVENDVKRAFSKVMASITHDKATFPKGWSDAISFRPTVQNIFDPQVFDTLFRAAANRQRLEILYRKPGPGQVAEERIIDPYNVSRVGTEWYVFAYDLGRKDYRTFAPARIKSITHTGKKFLRRKDFCLKQHLSNSFNIYGGTGELQDVRIEFSARVADHIREKIWGGQQGIRELENGGVELHLRLTSLVEIHRWILNWGGDAIPTFPPQLHEMFIASAQKILDENNTRTAAPAKV